ncbi:hypothetical protein V6M85_01645 [Sulfolobus tengchongensis]|uniref:DUF4352 domain-containing protein n=1 Tax=Sulfolobus tengchongensis TaxID=207809 RepID=A0AAX4L2J3_9CREN
MSRRKNSRALSVTVTALILVIALVVVVAFVLFEESASSPNIHLVSAYIAKNSAGNYYLYVTVSNTGSANGQILGVIVQAGGSPTSTSPTGGAVTVPAGGTASFSVSIPSSISLTPGEQVTFELVTNTGAQVTGVATVLS